MEIKSEVQNLTWPLSAVSPQSSLFLYLYSVHRLRKFNNRYKRSAQGLMHGKGCGMLVKFECFLTGGLEACFLWQTNYKPEIFPLECSSGLLLLAPKPPPLYGLLEDPVFVFPEVMEPRCKLLYLWRQSLFLGRNVTVLERGRTYCLQENYFSSMGSWADWLINFIRVEFLKKW